VAWDTGADTVRRPTSPEAVTAKIVELMDRPGKDPASITQADVDRARNFTSGQYLLRHERVSERSFLPGWFEMMGVGYAMDAALPALVQRVSLADVRRIAAARLSIHTVLA
jgi:predicted Zn-dependent peptidase